MKEVRYLCDLNPGQKGVVTGLTATGTMRRRLLDLGLIEHTEVECLGRSPGGDPAAYLVRVAFIAIRFVDGITVQVRGKEVC